MSIFTTTKNTFEHQREGERIIAVTRKHWFHIAAPMAALFLLALAPFGFYAYFTATTWYKAAPSFYWFFDTVYYLALWNFLFYRIMVYVLNTVIVTNRRVIENQQDGLFRHTIHEVELANIQDISVKTFGIDATLLGFGDIEIQTAGTEKKFSFPQLPHPKNLKETIMKAKYTLVAP